MGVDGFEVVSGFQQPVNRVGGTNAVAHAFRLEVVGLPRGVDEQGARRESGDDLGKVERHLPRVPGINAGDARNVTLVAPAGQVALLIAEETVEPATADDNLDAGVEGGNE